ncbi:MAG TPA: GTPase Era [Actinomycetota bacterium]|jgi:GTP-binding protein Era|nr:GTPase Era [Actinomycetota bacterium]
MSKPEGELRLGSAPEGYRSGFVSLVGRPNVGKSTLLNQILRHKVAITSDRPQTTRNTIRGVYTTDEAQLVFVDTPGLHKPVTALGKRLNRAVRSTLGEVDAVVFLVDAADGVGGGDAFIADVLKDLKTPVVVALNKIDAADGNEVAAARDRVRTLGGWPSFPTSGRSGAGVKELVEAIVACLPEGPLYYPPDTLTDQPERTLVAELVREKVLELTHDEIPHSVAVVVDEMEPDDEETMTIDATIYVERESQKGIVIGKGGGLLKVVGTTARKEIEALLGTHVFLRLRVKVERDWQRRATMVDRFGYGS